MMKRLLVLALLMVIFVAALSAVASTASAAQITKIQYLQNGIDYYVVTPTEAGEYRVEIRWADANGVIPPIGSTGPGYPDSEVDVVVQGVAKVAGTLEPYADLDIGTLYEGINPQEGVIPITANPNRINKPLYLGVVGWINDRAYRLRVWWTPGSTGIETLVIDTANEATYPGVEIATGDGGMYEMLATSGSAHSVVQYWKGTLNRAAGASDVWANWDDYNYGRDDDDMVIADNWLPSPTKDDMVAPLVTDTAIPGTGQYAAKPGWYLCAPEIWTAASHTGTAPMFNTWGNILNDTYPQPGTLTWQTAPAWHTLSYPEARVTTEKPTYFWGMINLATVDNRSLSQSSQMSESMTYQFYGDSFTWVHSTGPKGGNVSVKVDGVEKGPIDTYAAGSLTHKVATPFTGFGATAVHSVVLQAIGKNPLSGGTWTYHDYFIGKTDAADPVATAHRQNNSDGSTGYDWGHTTILGASISNCKAANGALAYTFNKTAGLNSITWKYAQHPRGGIVNVYIDGKQVATIDEYASAVALGSRAIDITALATGWHTIFILNGGKNPAALGSWMYHDAFVIGAATIEN